MMTIGGSRVVSRSLIGDISNIASVVVSMVLDMLDSAIREQDTVAPLHIALAIVSLVSIYVGATVVIMHAIRVMIGVGGLLIVRCGGMGDRSRSVIDRWQDWDKPTIS